MPGELHILGVRHHGPGSARSALRALEIIKPDCVLIEGPPDADDLIAHVARPDLKPPVAILIHDVQTPANAVYYPFAEFSPEWQAMRWAVMANVPVRFMDLPQSLRMAVELARVEAIKKELDAALANKVNDGLPESGATNGETPAVTTLEARAEPDPLQQLAEAAGFDDGERWWEHVVEGRRDGNADVFAAIREAMAELRAGQQQPRDPDEPLREAWMRRTVREAQKEGFRNIAVICGAWHAPALDVEKTPKKQDDETLKGLAKMKVAATWVPWTYDRLAFASGYGAGVHSPGWYEHLWTRSGEVLESWMTRVARLLREKDIDCSSAHVIEAVRLSETLATLRGRPLADLSDIADAARSIFCFDSDLAMRLIGRELLVGFRMGEVPEDTPMVPLQQDLLAQQKRLRLKPEAQDKEFDLDLRNQIDRDRSVLLHRLRLLGIDWGTPEPNRGGKGTFHELWRLQWDPSFAIRLIEAGVLGTTIERAAGAKLAQLAREAPDLRSLAAHLQDAMLADLGEAAKALVRQIENAAAISSDVALLMETLPSLASLIRYGNVRQTDETMVRHIVDGMMPRITVGLGGAVSSLNDDAAEQMAQLISSTSDALGLLESEAHLEDWFASLTRITDQDTVHGLVRGRCARLLLDANRLDTEGVSQRISRTLSRGNDPAHGARWLEGFLRGSGLLLIHDPKLLRLIDEWVVEIQPGTFEELLPLLRRTFSTFPKPERKQLGQLVKSRTTAEHQTQAITSDTLNHDRAARALPFLLQILGGER